MGRGGRWAWATVVAAATLAGCAARGPAGRIVRIQAGPPVLVAHRGASAQAPENTLAAFRQALADGVPAAECDVHVTADGEVVVLHDPTLERTTNGAGDVAARTWAELRPLDAGGWFAPRFAGEPVPALGQLLDLVRGKLVLFIELKDGAGLEERVAALVDARRQRSQVAVLSFDAARVARAKRLMPDVPALVLHRDGASATMLAEAVAIDADGIALHHALVDADVVARAHDAGLAVFVFTVNDAAEARRLAALGVDGVISDTPARIAAGVSPAAP